MRQLIVWTIRGYQRLIARYLPPVCRFEPSCSRYTETALEEHGLLRGLGLGTWRILRCNPLCAGGLDPVPGRPLHGE
jgi:putative membrane protein insertion efficiency factor